VLQIVDIKFCPFATEHLTECVSCSRFTPMASVVTGCNKLMWEGLSMGHNMWMI